MSSLVEEIKESIDILSETKMIDKEQKTNLLVKLEKGNWFNWKKDGDLKNE
jgi:hypothetical protein